MFTQQQRGPRMRQAAQCWSSARRSPLHFVEKDYSICLSRHGRDLYLTFFGHLFSALQRGVEQFGKKKADSGFLVNKRVNSLNAIEIFVNPLNATKWH